VTTAEAAAQEAGVHETDHEAGAAVAVVAGDPVAGVGLAIREPTKSLNANELLKSPKADGQTKHSKPT